MASAVDAQGGTEAEVKAMIDKARVAFLQLNIYKSKEQDPIQTSRLFFIAEQRHGGP